MMEGKNNGCLIAFVSVLITALFLGMAGIIGWLLVDRNIGSMRYVPSKNNQNVLNVMTQYDAYMDSANRRMEALNREIAGCEITDDDGFWSGAGKIAKAVGCFKQMKACVLEVRDNLKRINVTNCPPDFVSSWTVFVQKLDGVVSVFDRATTFNLGMASAWSELATMGDEVGMELDNANNNMLEIAESYGYERRNVTEVDFLEGVK